MALTLGAARNLGLGLGLGLLLTGCASSGMVASASNGGGSGGSPLQGSPAVEARTDAPTRATRDVATRDTRFVREAPVRDLLSSRHEFHMHVDNTCRQCR